MSGKAYIVSAIAVKYSHLGFEVNHRPMLLTARSEEEALGMAIKNIKEKLPPSDGWSRHDALAMEVTFSP